MIKKILEKINISKNDSVSIQGNLGSYSHIAASHIFGREVKVIERDNFTDVFEDLREDRVKYIVVPIENSTHGSVYQNYDNLSKYEFNIVGELYLKINFHLIAHPNVDIKEIGTIYTHPVGMNQIKGFLREYPNIKPVEFSDTAGSVKMIQEENLTHSAAAASKFAAEVYGMQVLKENIQENSKNYTRFFVLSKSEVDIKTNGDERKTTIQFQLGEEAGSLYKSLRCFADRDIALSKIESRPIIDTDWEYRFYVDVEASVDEEKLQNAFNELTNYVKDMKILGSYFKGEYIDT